MTYFIHLLKKALSSMVITIILILALWGTLYQLTDFETVTGYLAIGFIVCILNTMIRNLRQDNEQNLLWVKSSWFVMAGVVLVLYHAGFTFAAVFVAAAILASPFFWATMYEAIVGFVLLTSLARNLF